MIPTRFSLLSLIRWAFALCTTKQEPAPHPAQGPQVNSGTVAEAGRAEFLTGLRSAHKAANFKGNRELGRKLAGNLRKMK